jgi:hypothetical protein
LPHQERTATSKEDIGKEEEKEEENSSKISHTQQWTCYKQAQSSASVIHTFSDGPCGLRQTEAPFINRSSAPPNLFMLIFLEKI